MAETREYFIVGDENGSLCISEDVIASIAATAAAEVEGVAALYGAQKTENQHGARRTLGHSVKVTIDGNDITIGVSIIAIVGKSISEIGAKVQTAVKAALESALGVSPAAVNIRVAAVRLK